MNKALITALLASLLFHGILLFFTFPANNNYVVVSAGENNQVNVSMGSLKLVSDKAGLTKIAGSTNSGSGFGSTNSMDSAAQAGMTNPYFSGIREKIELAKHYPEAARLKAIEGISQVEFVIEANGQPGQIKLAKSSNNPILDNEALAIIRRAAPFAPIPIDIFHASQITLRLPIVFELKSRG